MGERPVGHTLDRRETTGDYTPENCRWATIEVQNGNRRKGQLSNIENIPSGGYRVLIQAYGKKARSRKVNTLDEAIELRDFAMEIKSNGYDIAKYESAGEVTGSAGGSEEDTPTNP